MSQRALAVLDAVDTVVGYTTYIDLIRPLIESKKIIQTTMMKEVDRVGMALEKALEGNVVAIVCSGDPGVYAMAGLVFEICRERDIPVVPAGRKASSESIAPVLQIEIVPGIPALCAGAALLGAPLMHDFAAISLSDLLTPWEMIERRLEAAAESDFVIVLYNPKSKRRDWQLTRARDIVMAHRSGKTPVGIVSRAMREGQSVEVVELAELHNAPVDMQTAVFIGNSKSLSYFDFMVTPRGYAAKYDMG